MDLAVPAQLSGGKFTSQLLVKLRYLMHYAQWEMFICTFSRLRLIKCSALNKDFVYPK